MFYIDTQTPDSLTCIFMPHNPIKDVQNIHKVIEKSGNINDHLYILHCSTPQENILKNSDWFTHSDFGKLPKYTSLLKNISMVTNQ